MANISEFIEQKGEFLKSEIVGNGCTAKIIGEATIEHNDKFNTDRLYIPVRIGDKDYTFDASKTNARTITATLGEDTAKWIDKEIVLETYKTKTSEGKLTTAINVKSIVM